MDETRLCKIISGDAVAVPREREKLALLLGKPEDALFAVSA
jgi:hypothetical protein